MWRAQPSPRVSHPGQGIRGIPRIAGELREGGRSLCFCSTRLSWEQSLMGQDWGGIRTWSVWWGSWRGGDRLTESQLLNPLRLDYPSCWGSFLRGERRQREGPSGPEHKAWPLALSVNATFSLILTRSPAELTRVGACCQFLRAFQIWVVLPNGWGSSPGWATRDFLPGTPGSTFCKPASHGRVAPMSAHTALLGCNAEKYASAAPL